MLATQRLSAVAYEFPLSVISLGSATQYREFGVVLTPKEVNRLWQAALADLKDAASSKTTVLLRALQLKGVMAGRQNFTLKDRDSLRGVVRLWLLSLRTHPEPMIPHLLPGTRENHKQFLRWLLQLHPAAPHTEVGSMHAAVNQAVLMGAPRGKLHTNLVLLRESVHY